MNATIVTDFDFGVVLTKIGRDLAERPKLRAAGCGVTGGLTAARALRWVL